MDYIEGLKLLAAAISGGAVTTLTNYFISRKKEDRTDFERIVATWENDNSRLRKVNEADRAKIDELERKLFDLQNKILLMESSHSDLPLPQWLKDTNGVMLAVNKAFEDYFLLPIGKTAGDYLGNNDFHIWPNDVAERLFANDREVMRRRKPVRHKEIMNLAGHMEEIDVIRYPRFSDRTLIGVAGIALVKWE